MTPKRCDKCGKVSRTAAGRCARVVKRFGGLYYCGGNLAPIEREAPTETPARGRVVDYAGKRDQAERELSAAITRIKRATTSAELWRGRLKYYTGRTADPSPRPKPRQKPRKPTRLYQDEEQPAGKG